MPRRDEISELIELYRRKLHHLEVQRALYGIATPPYILMDIEFAAAEIERLEYELAQIGPADAVPDQRFSKTQVVLLFLDRPGIHIPSITTQIARILNIASDQIGVQMISSEDPIAQLSMPLVAAHRLWELYSAADAKLQSFDLQGVQLIPQKIVSRLLGTNGALQHSGEEVMSRKLLLVDNAPNYLDATADYLEACGYQVYRAVSFERAKHLLDYLWVHVALVDLRMHDDDDPTDESGLTLARDEAYAIVPKIVLTRWPSFEAVRKALGPSLSGLPPAVDFVNKLDDIETMLQAINQVFERYVRINFDLKISHTQHSSFPSLINLIEPEHDNTRLLDRSAELEDLLRRLFYDSKQITIGRVLKHCQRRIVLELFAYNDLGVERQYVVSCGKKADVAAENQHYAAVVPGAASNHSTIKTLEAETMRFAATAYMLSSGDLEEITSFREYYQSKPPQLVAASLQRLYHETLAAWYRKGRRQLRDQPLGILLRNALGLSAERLAPESLAHQLEAIGQHMVGAGLVQRIEALHDQVTLWFGADSAVTFPNPAAERYQQPLNPNVTVLSGFIHGNIDAESILVDSSGQIWLIDFSRAGHGPLLLDFILLETVIKLELLDTLDLQLRHTLEQRLLAATALTEPLNDDTFAPELQRALIAIESIRASAASLAGAQLEAYNLGLFFCALNYLTNYQPELQYPRRRLMPYAHAFLQAALIAQRLADTLAAPAPASDGFWLDETNQVAWVEGRRVELTTQEYAILRHLYQDAGRLCKRQEIADHVLGTDYSVSEESRLNSAISRLRLKLEPHSKRPKYLKTVRGRGYRLDVPKHPASSDQESVKKRK